MAIEQNRTSQSELARIRVLRALPLAERTRLLEIASEAVAPLYQEDLSKPPLERELTAFTALDRVDVLEDEEMLNGKEAHAY
jgi:hypothetical protein